MDASVIVLGSPSTRDAAHYAAALARFLAVPLLQGAPTKALAHHGSTQLPAAPGPALAQKTGAPGPAPAAPQPTPTQPRALLRVLARPPARHMATITRLLGASSLPLLVVPSPSAGHLPPRRIALAAAGEPFVLEQGLHLLHALLLTLPTRLTVLHAQLPHDIYSAADALHAVQSCGLAWRYLAVEGREVPALAPVAGILAGVQQVEADLLVLPVWPRRRAQAFSASLTARLLAQCPVPVLLLPVSSGGARQLAA